MKKTIWTMGCFVACMLLLAACQHAAEDITPQRNNSSGPGQALSFNLKEFIGIYEGQILNQANTSSLVISRTDEGFDGTELWLGGQWDGVNGDRIKVRLTEEKRNGDVVVKIPNQTIQDSLTIEGEGTFYYYDKDFYIDLHYNIKNGADSKHYGLVAVKKVYNQDVIININVGCECDCTCDGQECDCTCTCDD